MIGFEGGPSPSLLIAETVTSMSVNKGQEKGKVTCNSQAPLMQVGASLVFANVELNENLTTKYSTESIMSFVMAKDTC